MITADEIAERFHFKELSPEEAYTWIFQLDGKGSDFIENEWEDEGKFHANPVGYFRFSTSKEGGFRILFKDTFFDELKTLQRADFAILNGVTYFGRKNLSEHASKMYAMIFDLDDLDIMNLANFLHNCNQNGKVPPFYPKPNIIACSGHGLHLYYLFENPINLYPNTKVYLKALKYALTERMWNKYTSRNPKPQLQGINQGFRVIGGKTKIEGTRVRAFAVNPTPWQLKDLATFTAKNSIKVNPDELFKESRYTLEEARKKYPEWYESLSEKKIKGHWTNKKALYEWWINKAWESSVGHRYFYVMALAIYAVKCGIPLEELKKDAINLIPLLNEKGKEMNKPFTESDMLSALECYDLRYVRFPRSDIEKLCSIRIDPNKRNGRTQEKHLQGARAIRDINNENWREGNGRKSKFAEVIRWKEAHPDGTMYRCQKETGMSINTIKKYWGAIKAQRVDSL